MLCLYMLFISSCSSHLLIYDKKLSNHPFFIQVTLGDLIFFKFSMIWVFFGIGGKKAMLCIFFSFVDMGLCLLL